MSLVSAPPDGSAGVSSRGFASFETNRLYAPDVLDIEDLWQWESLGSGVSKTKPFALDGLDASSPETARLVVYLQGGSDAVSVVDHHVQVFVNGALVAEESFDGAVPHRVEADVPVSLLAADERAHRHERGRHGCLLPRLPRPLRGALSPGVRRALRGLRRGLLRGRERPRSPGSPPPPLSSTSPPAPPGSPATRPGLRSASAPRPATATSPSHQTPSSRPASSSPSPPPACAPRRTRPTTSSSLQGPSSTPLQPLLERRRVPGPLHLRRLPRGDRLLLRWRAGLRRGHPRLPLLRLPPVATSFAPLRPPPR